MIRIVDERTSEYEQNPNCQRVATSKDAFRDERYIRLGNNVQYFENVPPPRYPTDPFHEHPMRRLSDHGYQNPYQTQHGTQININRVIDNRQLHNNHENIYQQQDFQYRVPILRNVIDRSGPSWAVTQQQPPEIYQPMAPSVIQRSTVLRHSSSIPREELLTDIIHETNTEITRQPTARIDPKRNDDFIKVLNPDEINKNVPTPNPRSYHVRETSDLDRLDQNQLNCQERYHLLKKQLLSREPILNRIQKFQPSDASDKKTSPVANKGTEEKFAGESIIFSDKFNIDPIYHPYAITKELSESKYDNYNPEDLTLRYEVLVFLWILLGEARLLRTGYPSASIHLVLWRVVHICCSVSGVKSAAAVPLPDNHNCGDDMLCFRDHVHRLLEVCAPTRDLWKQFGWASLTVDAVMRKVYKQELFHVILQHIVAIPTPIRMAIHKLAILGKEEKDRVKKQIISRINSNISKGAAQFPNKPDASSFRPILPKPLEKRKRGRPIKIKKNLPDTGRIQRVMLWRFIMNLLEEPGNEDCIHWVRREEGIFRILNTDWLARIWGRRHGNPRMTYEKMARAMRTYYRSKVLQPVPRTRNLPRKLVYKFNPVLIRKLPFNRSSSIE